MKSRAKRTLTLIMAVIMLLSVVLSALIIPAFAEEEAATGDGAVNAVLTPAKGGATSIATLTFDDGHVKTATKLNELCAKYDARASLVLVSKNYVKYDAATKIYKTTNSQGQLVDVSYFVGNPTETTAKAAEMNSILSAGYLDVVSHSRNHIIVNTAMLNDLSSQFGDMTVEQLIKNEIQGSLADLKKAFPDYDTLVYGIPSSSHANEAYADLYATFYAARNGDCVLYNSSCNGKMQSVDPAVGNALGSWYRPYGVRLMQVKDLYAETNAIENIIGYLDTCVANGGWFIGTAHGIVEDENYDISVEELSMLMAKMQKYQNAGKLWVAGYTEAVKYVRERQASTVSAYTSDGVYYVNVAMADKTADGLPLTADVFNMPLTVKVEVPRDWVRADYTLNGEKVSAYCVPAGAKNYAYVDVVPNSGDIAVTDGTLPEEKDNFYPGKYVLPDGAWDYSTEENLAKYPNILFGVWESESDFEAGEAPVLWRSSDPTATNYSAGLDHNFIGAKDSDGTLYYKFNGNDLSTETASGKINYTRYVHLYQSTTLIAGDASTTQLVTCQNEELILDLGGNKLTLAFGIRIGGSSGSHPNALFTIKNGFADYPKTSKSQIQSRPDTTMIWENVDFTVGYTSYIVYDGGANLIRYKDCVIRATQPTNYFYLADDSSEKNHQIFELINTDVIYDVTPTVEMFQIMESYGANINKNSIYIDKGCSFTNVPADKWLRLSEGFSYSASSYVPPVMDEDGETVKVPAYLKGVYVEANGQFRETQLLQIEVGVEFKSGTQPPASYTFFDVDYTESVAQSHKANSTKKITNTVVRDFDELATLRYVDALGRDVTDYWMLYDEENDSYTMVTNIVGYTMAKIDAENKIIEKAWTDTSVSAADLQDMKSISVLNPETGEVYNGEFFFLYNAETAKYDLVTDYSKYDMVAYEDASQKIAVKTWADGESLTGSTSTLPKNVYIKLYNDANFADFNTYSDYNLTIDLNGYTLTNKGQTTNVQFGEGMSGSWKEREISFINTSGKAATLDLSAKTGSFFQSRPGSIVLFENIDITYNSGTMFNEGGAKSITFRNCTVTCQSNNGSVASGSVANPICVKEFFGKSDDNYREYVFDNTTLKGLNAGGASTGTATDGRMDRLKITFKNGSVVDNKYKSMILNVAGAEVKKVILNIETGTKFTASFTPGTAFVTKNDGLTAVIEENYYSDFEKGTKIDVADLTVGEGTKYYHLLADGEGAYAYRIVGTGIDKTYVAEYNEKGNAVITLEAIKKIPAGGTITFLTDLEYSPEGNTDSIQRIQGYANDITFDLNNFTFTLNYRWQLSSAKKFLFKNGNIESGKSPYSNTSATFFGNAGADSVFTFENVNFTIVENNLFQLYSGGVVVRGGTINAPGLAAINLNTTNYHSVTLDGVTVNAGIAISTSYMKDSVGMKNVYEINNCVINASAEAFRVTNYDPSKVTIQEDDFVKINVSKSYINGDLAFSENIKQQFLTVNLSDTYLDRAPAVDSLYGTLTYGEGNILMGIEDPEKEAYSYVVTANKPAIGNKLQVNVTLHTNFDLNFFAKPDAILGVYLDGELLSFRDRGSDYMYTATFAAHEAADAKTFEVLVKSGNVTYRIPLEYSVLTYAEKLVAKGASTEATDLIKAAMAYVEEAYEVANAEVPAELQSFDTAVDAKSAGDAQLPDTLTKAILSVQFKLESSVNLVLTIADGYNGTVTVNGVAYEVEAGDVLNIPLRAKELAGDISVSAVGESARSFTLAGYVNSAAVQNSEMKALVEALYTYAVYAKEYADYVAANGGVMD